MIIMNT